VGEGVALRVVPSEIEQQDSMWAGTRRLLQLAVPSQTKALSKRLSREATLALTYAPHDSTRALIDDCIVATLDRLLRSQHGPVWDEASFESLREEVGRRLPDLLHSVVKTVAAILAATRAVEQRADVLASPGLLDALTDAKVQLARLVYPGFVSATGVERLTDVHRYIRAIGRRLEVLPADPRRDRDRMARVVGLQERLERLPRGPGRDEIRWMIEELRVSVFAQTLGTAFPVSEQRVDRAIAEMEK
jgi:ATP-dependent helicase HrpA